MFKIILFILIFLPHLVFGQNIDFNTIILPEGIENITIEEKLVQLAWKNNPISHVSNNNLQIAKHNINLAGASWINNIRLTGNVNEFVIDPGSDQFNRAQFFPLYNISASFALGDFISNPQNVKIAKLEYQNELENINQQKLLIRAEVLRRFYEYQTTKKILDLESELTENALNTFSLIEEQFLNGETSIEKYNEAYKAHKSQQITLENIKNQLKNVEINIEELIGIDLESLLN